eukprot:gene11974-8247_t
MVLYSSFVGTKTQQQQQHTYIAPLVGSNFFVLFVGRAYPQSRTPSLVSL